MVDSMSISEALHAARDQARWYADHGTVVNGFPTGLRDIDETTWGLRRRQLSVLVGEPGVGKSCLALGAATWMVTSEGLRVLWVTLDHDVAHVARSLIASQGMVDEDRLRTGAMSPTDRARQDDVIERFTRQPGPDPAVQPPLVSLPPVPEPFRILADRAIDCDDIVSEVAEMAPVDLLVVDGFARLVANEVGGDDDPTERVVRTLEGLADQFDMHVMVTLQIDGHWHRYDKRPQRADLHRHGAVATHAEVVMGLYRDEIHDDDSMEKGIMEVEFLRNGSGRARTVKLAFLPHVRKVANLARSSDRSRRR